MSMNKKSSADVCLSVGLKVYLSVTCRLHARTAERIEVLFEVQTPWGPRNIVLDVGADPLRELR